MVINLGRFTPQFHQHQHTSIPLKKKNVDKKQGNDFSEILAIAMLKYNNTK